MFTVKLRIDVSGSVGNEAWTRLRQFEPVEAAVFGDRLGRGGACNHLPDLPHPLGEWISAEIQVETPLLAQYAMAHYLEQDRVLDADVVA
ncbi:MAG: hypothetical protein JST79_11215 [Acidobacteria bacterium]|nr:hypothetical protein [Acidobacteriota bacterium]